jgi:hypothetical protein
LMQSHVTGLDVGLGVKDEMGVGVGLGVGFGETLGQRWDGVVREGEVCGKMVLTSIAGL